MARLVGLEEVEELLGSLAGLDPSDEHQVGTVAEAEAGPEYRTVAVSVEVGPYADDRTTTGRAPSHQELPLLLGEPDVAGGEGEQVVEHREPEGRLVVGRGVEHGGDQCRGDRQSGPGRSVEIGEVHGHVKPRCSFGQPCHQPGQLGPLQAPPPSCSSGGTRTPLQRTSTVLASKAWLSRGPVPSNRWTLTASRSVVPGG